MKLIYEEEGTFEGIPTYRFKAPNTLFANGTVYPPNEGFCPCLESGIQNVSSCRFSTCRLDRGVGAEGVGAWQGSGLVCPVLRASPHFTLASVPSIIPLGQR